MFKFIKETHKYSYNDIEIPGVTSILPYNFFGNDTEYNRIRGQYVHQMIYLYNMKVLDEKILDPVLKTYLVAYEKFIKDFKLSYDNY